LQNGCSSAVIISLLIIVGAFVVVRTFTGYFPLLDILILLDGDDLDELILVGEVHGTIIIVVLIDKITSIIVIYHLSDFGEFSGRFYIVILFVMQTAEQSATGAGYL